LLPRFRWNRLLFQFRWNRPFLLQSAAGVRRKSPLSRFQWNRPFLLQSVADVRRNLWLTKKQYKRNAADRERQSDTGRKADQEIIHDLVPIVALIRLTPAEELSSYPVNTPNEQHKRKD